ncbi:hypothetical protein ACPCTG_31755 [Streptomyces pseudogriseolus]|uniref:hypothetical protein n=1 Tax=Streptomyces pseudogriseolus TaxID=36817 RepID=UPI003FA2A464
MRIRTTTAGAILAVLALTASCGSNDGDGDAKPAPATSATTADGTPSTEASLSEDDLDLLKTQCSDAIAEAAPSWDDWNYNPGTWQDDPRTPEECLPLADDEVPSRGNRAFMDALVDGLEIADDPRADQ